MTILLSNLLSISWKWWHLELILYSHILSFFLKVDSLDIVRTFNNVMDPLWPPAHSRTWPLHLIFWRNRLHSDTFGYTCHPVILCLVPARRAWQIITCFTPGNSVATPCMARMGHWMDKVLFQTGAQYQYHRLFQTWKVHIFVILFSIEYRLILDLSIVWKGYGRDFFRQVMFTLPVIISLAIHVSTSNLRLTQVPCWGHQA